MTARAETIVLLVASAALVALVLFGDTSSKSGIVYATWPEQECRHVKPAHRFDCDHLPEVIDDIIWVSEEWRP